MASLRSAGFGLRAAQSIVLAAIHYTFGCVIEEQADKRNRETAPKNTITGIDITNLIEARNAGGTNDENFIEGLELIIAGGSNLSVNQ